MSTTVYAPSFDKSVRDLADHPVINTLAAELLAAPPEVIGDITTADGRPTYDFISAANAEFNQRTGEHGRFIGTVANAILARRTALLDQAQAEERALLAAALPDEVSEARAADLEARMAIKDMWAHGFPRCPLTKYATSAGNLADRLADGGA
ncbi:hypothetical protein EF903_17990 [Streptomyces sp. WAC05292]|uniref:hypothetical protein n=1 Tax=Streptomyces sp. WAC05292 TaxID=2487418 RepID=UPI000F738D1F|nr:hypothetical protein [Streptomyces sp. WAC05292]RSS87003.1 hypothetical protein EF903_17990 [Streptomyces sp. WAC05292]